MMYNPEKYYTSHINIEVAKRSEWQCQLSEGVVFTPLDGKEPNFFWRWMQYVCFGFKWSKNSD